MSDPNSGPLYRTPTGQLVTGLPATISMKQRSFSGYLEPNNIIPSSLLTTSQYDCIFYFDEVGNNVDLLDYLYLSYQVTNTDAVNALHLTDSFTHCSYVWIQSGSIVMQEIRNLNARAKFLLMNTSEALESILPQIGIDQTTYQSSIIIPPLGTHTFRLPVSCLLNTCGFPMWRKGFRLSCTFRFEGGAKLVMAGSPAPISAASVSGPFRLLYTGRKLDDHTRSLRDNNLCAGIVNMRYCDDLYVSQGVSNILANVPFTTNSTIKGMMLMYLLNLGPGSPVGEELYNSIPVENYALLSNGLSTQDSFGTYNFTTLWEQTLANKDWTNTSPLYQLNMPLFTYSDNIEMDLDYCSSHGHLVVKGQNEQYQIVSSAPQASATLNIWATLLSFLKVDFRNSTIEIFRFPTPEY